MTSFVDVVKPATKSQRLMFNLLCIAGGSLFLALISQLRINLWFTPIPITMQTLGVLLIGALLGSKRGALAVVLYIVEGAFGLPVFSGGTAGLGILCGATAGYLAGFIIAAYVIGLLLERGWKESYSLTLVALCLGTLIIWTTGVLWLGQFVGISPAIKLGIYPFIVGSVLKIAAASAAIPSGWKVIHYFSK